MENRDDDIHPIVKGLTFVIFGFFTLYGLWAPVIAFVGGTLPIVGITIRGGLITGLLWLFIVDPIIMTVGYWIGLIVALPVHALISWLGE